MTLEDAAGATRIARRLRPAARQAVAVEAGGTLERLRFQVRCLPFRGALAWLLWRPRAPERLRPTPADTWPADARHGQALARGSFTLEGRTVADLLPLWQPRGTDLSWRRSLHSFVWLRDLRAAGGDDPRRTARDLLASWIEHHPAWDALAWAPDIAGRRLDHWLAQSEFLIGSAGPDLRQAFTASVARHIQYLAAVLPAGLPAGQLLPAAKGLVRGGASLPGEQGSALIARGLDLVERALTGCLNEDGGHVTRSPAALAELLEALTDLRAILAARGEETPEWLADAIGRAAPTLAMLRHTDGGLALFNGADEGDPWRLDQLLQRAGRRIRPRNRAADTGYERLQAGRLLVVADVGPPPPAGGETEAHAGTLAFEASIGRERLIVNCGARRGDAAWAAVQRATAAHATLVLADRNSSEIPDFGRRAAVPEIDRQEADGAVLLEACHDGYAESEGLYHRRRLFLAADGLDLRGEDRLEPLAPAETGDGASEADERALPFSIHFHLHPRASVTLSRDGVTAMIRLPKAGGWTFRARGAEIWLEDSVYLGRPGEIRRATQIVLRGEATAAEGARVQWALQRAAPGER